MINYRVVFIERSSIMTIIKKIMLLSCAIAVLGSFCACSDKPEETHVLDTIITEKLLGEQAEEAVKVSVPLAETVSDPVTAALENGDLYFSGIYTADGLIWQFFPDGTVDTYSNSGMIQRRTYSISYSGGDNVNKNLIISNGDNENKYRFKKITNHGFDIVLQDNAGNDGTVSSFICSSFYDALFNKKPFFNETYYNSGTAWIFTDDGFLKAYDAAGNSYTYLYNLDFIENDGILERYLLIGQNVGHEHEKITHMKILSYSAGKFTAIKMENGKEASDIQTFTKQ